MERMRNKNALILFLWATVAALMVVPALSQLNFEDQKNFFHFPHDPNIPQTPPTVSYSPPAHSSTPTVPSHGGPPNCGNPPTGEHHNPTPSPPKGEDPHSPPTKTPSPPTKTPSPPKRGYYHSPPTKTPSPPTVVSPPKIVTPPTTVTSPPSPFDPHSPPFTCIYWKNHPSLIWGLFGYWGSIGNAFGVSSSPPGFGSPMNLLQALSNTRTDGYGELYRQGTAAFLNSIAHTQSYPYTTAQVKLSFASALSSNNAAAAQAHLFKMANEGKRI